MTQLLSSSPLLDVQQAIFERLTGDSDLMGLVSGVGDEMPEDEQMPYVRIGESLSTQDNSHDTFGRVVVATLHVWTRARSNLPGQKIADRIGSLLDHQPDALSLLTDSHRVVRVVQEFDQALRDPKPGVRHHVIRFRIRTEQLIQEE